MTLPDVLAPIYDHIAEAIWVMERQPDGDYVVISTNSAADRSTRISYDEAVGRQLSELCGPEKAALLYPYYASCLEKNTPVVFEEYVDFADGRRWYQTTLIPQPPNHVIDMSTDITERRQAEKLLNAINHAQLQFIASTPKDRIFAELLDALLELTDSEYGFIGEILHTADGDPYLQTYAITDIAWNDESRAMYADSAPNMTFHKMESLFGACVTYEEVVIANDPANDPRRGGLPEGHPPLNAFLGLPFIHAGHIIGMVGIANRPGGYDAQLVECLQPLVTTCTHLIAGFRTQQRRDAAEYALRLMNDQLEARVNLRTAELQDAIEKLQALDAQKSQFVADVAHELRQPMTILTTEVYLLRHGREGDRANRIEKMNRQVSLLNELVENVLDLSRLDRAKTLRKFTELGLNGVVAGVTERYRQLAEEAELSFTIELQNELPLMLGDANQLAQVVTNLVVNAVRYTPSGSVTVRTWHDVVRSAVVVQVADTGMGIAPEDIPPLYDRFFRGKQHNMNKHIPGTGLGLAIVKEIVDLHSGWIELQTAVGQGTSFTVNFPAVGEAVGVLV